MNILKSLLTRYNQTNFLTLLLKMLDHKLCGWYLDVLYGYDVCLAWLWNPTTTNTIEIRFVYDMNNA
jgi:hypothetical protein